MYLVDTTVLSATDPTKKVIDVDLIYWMSAASSHLYLSAVTASEVVAGIAKARRVGASRKAESLGRWWTVVEELYGDRILSFDLGVARIAGEITDHARGFDVGFGDIAIAATARAHGLTVLTANEADFSPLGVPFLNPLKSLPALP